MTVPDGLADVMTLHCSYDHFEGQADIGFAREAGRVMRAGGRTVIAPLYLSDTFGAKIDPRLRLRGLRLDESMVRAIARQAEAERTRRAKIINAEGEQQAAQKLLDAAQILAPVPQAMQLRYLATLFDIAGERSSTIVFPFPIEMMQAWTSHAPAAKG